jgi:hypothetical protein
LEDLVLSEKITLSEISRVLIVVTLSVLFGCSSVDRLSNVLQRDDFGTFRSVKVLDEFEQDGPLIEKRFGKNVKIRKGLAHP